MDETIEIKVREKLDFRPWEEIPVLFVFHNMRAEFGSGANKKGSVLAMMRKGMNRETVKEIRWNWRGSPQGHYILNTGE